MRKAGIFFLGSAAILMLVSAGCGKKSTPGIDRAKLQMFQPLPEAVPAKDGKEASEAKIALGRMLFHDPRLSANQQISCNSCHTLSNYGVDGKPTSEGFKGQHGDRNSPTVYNAALHFVQFWDGRAPDVEEQAKGPMLNPVEMALPDAKAAIAVLKSIPEYVEAFKAAFPGEKDPVTFENVAAAIGAFERKLLTPSRWDKFLAGDNSALTEQEKAGLNKFLELGCQTCHMGVLLGGNLYQKLGLMKAYPDTSDPGRFQVTKSEADRMVFKVPSLRNVEKTGPYFHNGKVATLEQAVTEMAEYQLGKAVTRAEVESVVAFLKALTGELPAEYIQAPALPPSTPQTPKPIAAD
ncbi:MAG TPA: cytochrome-c peroxidase [Bryobacteraceae bacterium]|nr:cytochrome-c peroxidase [Bryobacteraceae bacterium]HOL73548.1 cytochrome-c peroxidase [Bryobacteraceae bacterium]HOQ47768.1 cytochrome-c peroxidase [Bryobacteraceae bacterium]HPQ16239.1 cytochrome-c peroxidase [Bryobacteraceae bacterium]HPU74143.1 cytochrome-c peroxidase [Bryobacteraceae bacterium]